MAATNIQHCLTRENIEIIELMTDMAQRHGYKAETKALIHQICDQAITAQQLNQRSHVELATAVTDLNHVTFDFAQSILEDEAELKGWIAMGKGPCRFMYAWGQFLVKAGCHPITTSREMGHNLRAIGGALNNVASVAYDFSAIAVVADVARDGMGFHPNPVVNTDGTSQPTTYVHERFKRNDQVVKHITHATDVLIKHIKENPSLNCRAKCLKLVKLNIFRMVILICILNIVEDAIKNAKEIVSIKGKESGSFRVTDQSGNVFRIDIQNKKARPYPVNPKSIIE